MRKPKENKFFICVFNLYLNFEYKSTFQKKFPGLRTVGPGFAGLIQYKTIGMKRLGPQRPNENFLSHYFPVLRKFPPDSVNKKIVIIHCINKIVNKKNK